MIRRIIYVLLGYLKILDKFQSFYLHGVGSTSSKNCYQVLVTWWGANISIKKEFTIVSKIRCQPCFGVIAPWRHNCTHTHMEKSLVHDGLLTPFLLFIQVAIFLPGYVEEAQMQVDQRAIGSLRWNERETWQQVLCFWNWKWWCENVVFALASLEHLQGNVWLYTRLPHIYLNWERRSTLCKG